MECRRAKKLMMEYIDGTLSDDIKSELDKHLCSCDECFEDIKILDDVVCSIEENIRYMETNRNFLGDVEEHVAKSYNPKLRIFKKRIKYCLIATAVVISILSLLLSIPLHNRYAVLNAITFGRVYDTSNGTFGKRLNISSTDQDIKITVTKAAADDIQTIIYFKIEGKNSSNYVLLQNSIDIKEEWGGMGSANRYVRQDRTKDGQTVIYLNPIDTAEKTITLSISRLISTGGDIGNSAVSGTWSFKIPINKIPVKEYPINRIITVGGQQLTLKKLISGTTAAYFDCSCSDKNNNWLLGFSHNSYLIMKNRKYDSIPYSSRPYYEIKANEVNTIYRVAYETVYLRSSSSIDLYIGNYIGNYILVNPLMISIDMKGKFPQEFMYGKNTLYFDEPRINDTFIDMTLIEPETSREYYSIFADLLNEDNSIAQSNTSIDDYILMDENGKEYDKNYYVNSYEESTDRHVEYCPTRSIIHIARNNSNQDRFILMIYGSRNAVHANQTVKIK